MSRLPVLFVSLFVLLLLAACTVPGLNASMVTGSGTPESRTFDFSDFTEVEAQSAFRVTITQGDSFSVEVTADDNVWTVLDIRQVGERVILGPRQFTGFTNATLDAVITMPALEELHLSGASTASFTDFASSEPFVGEVSGASRMEGQIEAAAVTLTVSGASRALLVGSGESLTASASGASQLDLEEFTIGDATIELSGASRGVVNASGTLNVEASGASNLTYVGNPTMGSINTSGASTVGQR
jgi:hypothetical protein